MSNAQLPERASLEYLKTLAKDRLQDLRRADPRAKLAAALLAVAREYGFSSWRALKTEIEQRRTTDVKRFFDACGTGDVEALGAWLAKDPTLVRAANPSARHQAWTGLHTAAKSGHADAVRLLLQHGADPHAREAGDNTYALHWAAARADIEMVRVLLDAGGDVHGIGDVHALDVIGWAAFYRAPGDDPTQMDASRRACVAFLIERGARHHIFSAMCVGERDLIRHVVEQDPDALDRRMSRFERGLTPVHFAIDRQRYDILDLLIELGADVEAEDLQGQTALAVAMLRGDREAIRRLDAAGARPPEVLPSSHVTERMASLAATVKKGVPMIYVPDVARALAWYTSIGFTEVARYDDDGVVNFGMVSYGQAELMFNLYGTPAPQGVSLWFYTDNVDRLYQLLKSRQLDAARAALAGASPAHDAIEFVQDIEDMFYGARQFCIRDLNGYALYFIQSD